MGAAEAGMRMGAAGMVATDSTDMVAAMPGRQRSGGSAQQRTGAGAKARRKAKRNKYAHFSRDGT